MPSRVGDGEKSAGRSRFSREKAGRIGAHREEMNKQGEMKVAGANETVMEVFEGTGFSEILNII